MGSFDISKGIYFYEAGNFAESLEFFLNFTEINNLTEATEVAYYLGLSAIKLEKHELAIEALEQVVTSTQDSLKINQFRLLLSIAYSKTDRLILAEKELQLLQSTQAEKTSELFNALAFIHFEKGDAENAIKFYENVLSEDPENITAMNGLGYILAEKNLDISRALVLCKQVCDKKANYAPYLDSLAWVYFKMNFTSEAKKIIEQAKRLLPESKIINEHYNKIFEL